MAWAWSTPTTTSSAPSPTLGFARAGGPSSPRGGRRPPGQRGLHGPLPLPRLRELATGLAEARRDMHRAGVVHRDPKPANVMLADDGPRVIDFGISRAAEFAVAGSWARRPSCPRNSSRPPPGRRPGRRHLFPRLGPDPRRHPPRLHPPLSAKAPQVPPHRGRPAHPAPRG
ncbi:protein kinase domain-containing protein, partial [Streptomyces africanus]|uniref:protein kinase domain-containing protein n=1 Tax=Streptomyces africanus TaxID=231024 RepID=UPI003CC5CBCE